MKMPTINKSLIEGAKTAIIFAIVTVSLGFYIGYRYELNQVQMTEHAVELAVKQVKN